MLSNKIKAQLMLVATFLLGVVIGASGLYLYNRQFNSSQSNEQELLNDLSRSLQLTLEQKSKVEEILKQSKQEYQELRNQNRPQFQAVRDRVRLRIKEVLSAEQKERYDEWNRHQDAKREQQRAR
jgi:hypothetical protein